MRTPRAQVPHATVANLQEFQAAKAAERSWADDPWASVQALRDAAADLTAEGLTPFTRKQLFERTPGFTVLTLRSALTDELNHPQGCIRRERHGQYRFAPGSSPVAREHVSVALMAAIQALAGEGVYLNSRGLTAHLSEKGLHYSWRAVRDGLQRLRTEGLVIRSRCGTHRPTAV